MHYYERFVYYPEGAMRVSLSGRNRVYYETTTSSLFLKIKNVYCSLISSFAVSNKQIKNSLVVLSRKSSILKRIRSTHALFQKINNKSYSASNDVMNRLMMLNLWNEMYKRRNSLSTFCISSWVLLVVRDPSRPYRNGTNFWSVKNRAD